MEYENKHGLKRTIRGAVRVAMAIAGGAFGEKYKQPKFIENSAQDSLYRKLTQMVDEGKFEKAENILCREERSAGFTACGSSIFLYE